MLNPVPEMLNSKRGTLNAEGSPPSQHMALEMWFTVDDDSIPYAGLAAVTTLICLAAVPPSPESRNLQPESRIPKSETRTLR